MQKPFLVLFSLICLLAESGCQSSSPLVQTIQPDKVIVPPLPLWIKEPKLQKTSPQGLQRILSGYELMKTQP